MTPRQLEILLAEVTRLRSEVSAWENSVIHPMALVSDSRIKPGAQIWQFASVIRHSRVGANTVVGACALIDGSYVGDNCRIGAHAAINPGTFVADDVFVGPGVMICNDPWPRVDKGDFDIVALLSGARVCVHIERGASIGARAVVLPGVVIGEEAMVAAGAICNRTIPARHLFKRCGQIVPIETRNVSRNVHAKYCYDDLDAQREELGDSAVL